MWLNLILTSVYYSLDIQDSTKEAKLVIVAEISGKGGLQICEFEYKINGNWGGMKRIFYVA